MVSRVFNRYPVAAPILLLVICIILPYWKLTTMQGVIITDDVFISDLMNDAFPYRFYLGEMLKQGELPFWYPPLFGGFPLLARAESGICYPLNLFLFGFLPPYSALNLVVLLTLVIAAVGMFLYAREINAGMFGALIAGISFAYCGFMVCHIKHLSTVNTVSLFPLGLFMLERALKAGDAPGLFSRWKYYAWFALIVGLQNLAGHIQTAYYSGLAYSAYFVFRMMNMQSLAKNSHKQKPPKAEGIGTRVIRLIRDYQTRCFVVSMIVAGGLAAIQLIPTYELVSLSQRSGGVSFDYASGYSYDPSDIAMFANPYARGDVSNTTYKGKGIFWEDNGYAGIVVLLLALFACVSRWKSWHVKCFATSAVAGFILVLGSNTPVYELAFTIIPGMKFFRFPTRFLFIVDASLAVLAAIGANVLVERIGKKQGNVTRAGWVMVALVAADLVFFQMRQNPIADMRTWKTPPKTAQVLHRMDSSFYRIYSPGANETHKAAFAKARGWSGDLQPYIDQREFLQPGSHVLYGFSTADGAAQLTPNMLVDIWGDQNRGGLIYETAQLLPSGFAPTPAFMNILNMNNVKYILSPWPFVGSFVEPMAKAGEVFMYRNPAALPHAFCVGKYLLAGSSDEAKRLIRSGGFNPSEEAIVYERPEPAPAPGPSATAIVDHYGIHEVTVRVSAPENTLLVLSDTYYPGWRAELDGKETKILQANYTQRAVSVPRGQHIVRFEFDSPAINWGMGISLGTAMLTVFSLVALKRRER